MNRERDSIFEAPNIQQSPFKFDDMLGKCKAESVVMDFDAGRLDQMKPLSCAQSGDVPESLALVYHVDLKGLGPLAANDFNMPVRRGKINCV